MSGKDQPAPGFYGKLPGLGDFVSRRLPVDFTQPWDLWLRESLVSSQTQMGEAWLDIYLTSPLWRFVLSSGVAGQNGWAGVLMPSVDRVGRYFPFTLACPLPAGTDPVCLLCEPAWLERAEELALSGLEDDWNIDVFDAEVVALGAPQPVGLAADAASAPGAPMRHNAWRASAVSPADVRQVIPGLLGRALNQMYCAYSLWWSCGSERVAPSLLTCQGLPPADGYAALIGGDWSGNGWWELGVGMPSPQPQDPA
ncbi:type VI secretion system-associated protein TagF [Thiocystis violacea]|uniref:type VI secretion system-associated protein TagF n=1 Tax=Thiocystis violacea TaxID=13725 RepID=UPI001904393D|nr:type VI secretion-associated protein [Thiocystis violacea]